MEGKQTTRTLVSVLVLTLLVGSAGVGATFAIQDDEGEARVRAVHVSPFLPNIDVFVENDPVTTNLTFGDVSGYETFEADEVDVEIETNGSGDEIFESEATLEAGVNYTLLAVGTIENGTVQFQPALLRDEFEIPDRGNASIRFVHASPDAPPVDVTIAETNGTLAENVSYRDDGPYLTLPAGDYTLEVRLATGPDAGAVIETRSVTLDGRTVRSAIAVGFVDPDAVNVDFPFSVAVAEDVNVESPSETTSGTQNETTTEAD